jgi:hypothetical protein
MKESESYLFRQVFSVVIVALLVITFYMIAVAGLSTGSIESAITPMLLIIIAITCLAILSEMSKLGMMLSKRK